MVEKNRRRINTGSAKIRRFSERDIRQVIETYKSAFAEEPWNEYMKCKRCGVNFGKKEAESVRPGTNCKGCGSLLELAEFWSAVDIIEDLKFALSMTTPIILVAEIPLQGVVGFVWGYRLPFEKFPFLGGKVSKGAHYMDDIAVASGFRRLGIGTMLTKSYILRLSELQSDEIVLRTDERNEAPVGMYRKLGFEPVPDPSDPRGSVYDPKFPDRIYLKLKLGG